MKICQVYSQFSEVFLFVARERADIVESKGVFGAPDLVIEILSAGTVYHGRG